MTSTTTPDASAASAPAPVTTRQKVGLGLGLLYALTNIPSAFLPAGGDEGPPVGILVVDSLLGVVGLVACVLALRGSRRALRVAAGALILITVTGLPALFVDVPMPVKAIVGFSVILTVVFVTLMFSGPRRATEAGR
jgi:hypothetical protein